MNTFPRWLKTTLLLVLLVLLVGGVWFYRIQERRLRQEVENSLSDIAHLKANQIAGWRTDQLGEANELTGSLFLSASVARWLADPQRIPPAEILSRFHSLQNHHLYQDILLVDANGNVRLSLKGQLVHLEPESARALSAALRDHKPVLTDLHTDEIDTKPHISVIAPLFTGERTTRKPIGAVILICDATQHLYPLIQLWPVLSDSAETLIVRRDGNDVLFLNDLRYKPDAALKLRISLSRADLPAVMAVQGREGIVEGKDYRGVAVLADIMRIPDSPWFLVAKVDVAEAFAASRFFSDLALALLVALAALEGAVVFVIWQRNQKAHYRALYRAEAAQAASEQRYGIVLRSIGDAVITTDAKGRVELLNPTAELLTGWRQKEAHGRLLEEVFHIINEDTRLPMENPVGIVLREGKVVGLANHTALIARNDVERPISDAAAPIRNEQNEIIGVVLVFRDQTVERAMQRALRESEKHFRTIYEKSPVGYQSFNAEGRILDVNPAWLNLLGYSRDEVIGHSLNDFFTPASQAAFREQFPRFRERRLISGGEFEMRRKDGDVLTIAFDGVFVRDAEGRLQHTHCVLHNVTERRKAETALRKSEERYRQIVKCLPDMIWIMDLSGRFTYASPSVEHMRGWTVEEWLQLTFRDVETPQQAAKVAAMMEEYLAKAASPQFDRNQIRTFESEELRKDGATFCAEIAATYLWSDDGKPVGIIGTTRDITERKRAEEAGKTSELQIRQLLSVADCLLWQAQVTRRKTGEFDWKYYIPQSGLYRRLFGIDPGESPVLLWQEIGVFELDDMHARCFHALTSGTPGYTQEFHAMVGGQTVWLREDVLVVERKNESAWSLVGVITDITGRKQAEAELQKFNRAMRLISLCNQEMVRATDEEVLLQAVCRLAVEPGGYRMAWVGFAEQDDAKSVRPVAQSGFEEGYLDTANVTWADTERGRGPVGTAIRTGKPVPIHNISGNPTFALWRAEAIQRGYGSCIALPLTDEGRCFGALTLYGVEPNAFDPGEIELLSELADDLAYGIVALRHQAGLKQAEKAVKASEIRLRTLIQTIPDLVWVKDVNGAFLFCNPSFERLFDVPESSIIGKTDYDFVEKSLADFFRQHDLEAMAAGGPTANEEWLTFAQDGYRGLFQTVKTPMFDAEGALIGILGVARDITGRMKAEQRVADESNFNQTVLRASPVGIVVFKAAGPCISANEAIGRITGGSREAVLKQNFRQLESWKNSGMLATAETALAEQAERNLETESTTTFGRAAWFSCRFVPFQYEGEPHLLLIVNDITERKQAEEAIRQSQALYHSLVEQLPAGVFRKDKEGRFVYVNQWFCRLRSINEEELVGRTPMEFKAYIESKPKTSSQDNRARPELADQGTKDHALIMQTGRQIEVEEKWNGLDGQPLYLHVVKFPVYDHEGKVIGTQGIQFDVTEHKRAEEALRESRALHHSLVEQLPAGIFRKDKEGRFVYVNQWFCRLRGVNQEELRGRTPVEFNAYEAAKPKTSSQDNRAYPDFADQGAKDHALIMQTGRRIEVEEKWTGPEGQALYLHVVKLPVYDHEGRIIGSQGIQFDVTERKQAEEEVERTAREWQATFDATNDAIWILDKDHHVLRTNKIAENYFRRTCCEMIGKPCWEIVHGTTEPIPNCPFVRAQKSRHRETMELRENGRWFEVIVDPILDATGQYAGAVHIVSDITERKLAGEKVRLRESFLSAITENQPGLLWLKDAEGRFLTVNKAFAIACGRSEPEQVHGLTDLEIWPKEQAEKYCKDDQQVMASGTACMVEEMILVENKPVWHETFKTPVRDDQGRVIGTTGYARDITERKRSEEQLREQAALLDAANDAIYIRTLDHTVTYWNDGAERLYGWTRAEAVGHNVHEFILYDRSTFETAQALLLTQGNWSGELKINNKAGKEILVFCRWTVLQDERGQPKEILVINTDITEKKQLEAQYLRAQRMEGIGALAGGIAHDLNNILQPILMTAPLMRQTIRDSENRAMLDTMESCAKRGADIIKQLLTFARGTPGVRVPLPLRHLMRDIDKIIRETFPRNIQLTVNTPKDLWLVMGDATQIHQALMNLCVNARDAMPEGGTLTLEAKNLTLNEAFTAMRPDVKPGPYVCVSVTDSGTGIPPELLDRIFEPFFTTKELGKGTGLGLATVLGIVRGHGGFVQVNSGVGRGTTFELYLPASPEAKSTDKSDTEHLPRKMHGELILVVDDETSVREVIQRTLEKHGCRILTAVEGGDALALFTQHRAEVKAVITDIMMPGMDGPSLVLALRQLEPRLPVLAMTGLDEQAGMKGMESLGVSVMLKPFARGELLTALQQAIAIAAEQGRTTT